MQTERKLIPNRPYLYFKGKLYYVHGVAEDTETGKQMVCYQALYPPFKNYVRDYDMFMSEVDRKKYPDAKQKYRFELCEEVMVCQKEN